MNPAMNLIDTLIMRGIAIVEYPPAVRRKMEQAAASWRAFCSLLPEVKGSFVFEEEDHKIDGAGYEYKNVPGATLDLKENFHVTLRAYERLKETARAVDNPEAIRFIYNAHDLIEAIEPLILSFASFLEEELNLPGITDEVSRGRESWFLRYLHYFGGAEPGEHIGKTHMDKSGFTPHLYESDPGLEYLDQRTREWLPMPVSEAQTVIIPNVQLQYKTEGALRATWHRVVATEKTARTGRFSMVCFVPLLQTPKYNKNAFGRLQDFPEGANYDVSHEEFSKFFTA